MLGAIDDGTGRRSPCGSVDRNRRSVSAWLAATCRSPCGSVDRNCGCIGAHRASSGRSPCGSVDRNRLNCRPCSEPMASLPVRERGSKHRSAEGVVEVVLRRSPCGSVDRNCVLASLDMAASRRSPCGSVDRNRLGAGGCASVPCRSPCGSVDRNQGMSREQAMSMVAPRAGAWIETPTRSATGCGTWRRSPCGSVDRNDTAEAAHEAYRSRSPCGSVDRNT